jgi:hypothetical protein
MIRQLERRISRLEQKTSPPPGPRLIIPEPGESVKAAIMRVCGPEGLLKQPPGAPPRLILMPLGPVEEET